MRFRTVLICLITLLILPLSIQAKVPVKWFSSSGGSIEQTLGLGDGVLRTAVFLSTVSLSDVDLWIVPELQPFVRLNQTHFDVVEANKYYRVTLIFSVPFGSETGLYDGTIHLKVGSETHPQTLKIELNIADAAATIGPEGGVIEVTDPESPICGVEIDIPPGALDQDTQFSVSYDGLKDRYGLATPPVVVDHPDIQFHENVNVSLPLREIPIEDTTLIVMMFDDELNNYVPTGVLVDVAAGDTIAYFQLSRLCTITTASIWDSLDLYKWEDDEFTSLLSHLKELTDEIEKHIEGGPLQDLEDLLDEWEDRLCPDVPCAVIRDIVAGPLMSNIKRLIDEVVSKLAKDMNICHDLGEDRIAFFPYELGGFDFYRFELETVNKYPCMGRCGGGCPGDDDDDLEFDECRHEFRYSQACLNHDSCCGYYGKKTHLQCTRPKILVPCIDDCLSPLFPICEKAEDCHKLDPNCDGCIDSEELAIAQELWKNGEITILELMEAIAIWKECTSQPVYQDDFEDGVIDTNLWVVGGSKGGYTGCNSGGGQWYNEEIIAADGYLQARATLPTSANSYGSQAWTRTVHDFNDGKNWVINFKWEPDIQTVGQWHNDFHFIEITDDKANCQNCICINPPGDNPPGTVRLYYSNAQDFSPTTWSIVINASASEATLYEGPDGTGTGHQTMTLDPNNEWYVRFMTAVGTSAGYPAKDCRINLYDFTATEN